MTTAKKRNLFEEVREGLEAYRDRRDTLPRRKLSAHGVKAIREQFGMSQTDMAGAKKMTRRRGLG
jgi:DNA-binding transcriptional regulator YiaG